MFILKRFGLFGVKLEKPSHPILNYIGVALTILSIITFFFVETVEIDTMNQNLASTDSQNIFLSINNEKIEIKKSRIDLYLESFSEKSKKYIGISMAIFSGILYGELTIIFFKIVYELFFFN